MMKARRLFLTALLIFAGLSSATAERTKLLIIEGASNHDWQQRKEILTAILSRDGSFDIEVVITPGGASTGKLETTYWKYSP
jgi:cyanophycinase-like exopeptidase